MAARTDASRMQWDVGQGFPAREAWVAHLLMSSAVMGSKWADTDLMQWPLRKPRYLTLLSRLPLTCTPVLSVLVLTCSSVLLQDACMTAVQGKAGAEHNNASIRSVRRACER